MDDGLRAVVAAVGRRLSVDVTGAELLHRHSNAVVLLPSAGWVLRIASAPDVLSRIAASVRLTRRLAENGFTWCVVPADVGPQPFVEMGRVVSVWNRVPAVPGAVPGGAALGRLLRELHAQAVPRVGLTRFDAPFADLLTAVERADGVLSPAQAAWLRTRISGLHREWSRIPFSRPWRLIHGDAHPNNAMLTRTGDVVMGDWDHAAIGPREWDLAQVHYTHRRFRHPSAAELDAFAEGYGWDIRTWEHLDTVVHIRELTGLGSYIRTAAERPFARQELQRRLTHLADGDTDTLWRAPPPTQRAE